MDLDLSRIVVGYNGTEACRAAARCTSALALRAGAAVDLVSVAIPLVPIGGFGWVAPYDETRYMSGLLEQRVKEGAALFDPGVEVTPHPILGTPAPEIVKLARERSAGLVVLGCVRHSTLERIFVGSTADRVVRLASTPTLVAASPQCPTRILVAADDSPFGLNALLTGLALARITEAEVRGVHVVTSPPPEAAGAGYDVRDSLKKVEQSFSAFIAKARELMASEDLPALSTAVRAGVVRDEVLAEAEAWKADLIVAGSHGRGFVGRAVLGSVSESLLRHSPVSVLIAPRSGDR